jgi:hypothetical protein
MVEKAETIGIALTFSQEIGEKYLRSPRGCGKILRHSAREPIFRPVLFLEKWVEQEDAFGG